MSSKTLVDSGDPMKRRVRITKISGGGSMPIGRWVEGYVSDYSVEDDGSVELRYDVRNGELEAGLFSTCPIVRWLPGGIIRTVIDSEFRIVFLDVVDMMPA